MMNGNLEEPLGNHNKHQNMLLFLYLRCSSYLVLCWQLLPGLNWPWSEQMGITLCVVFPVTAAGSFKHRRAREQGWSTQGLEPPYLGSNPVPSYHCLGFRETLGFNSVWLCTCVVLKHFYHLWSELQDLIYVKQQSAQHMLRSFEHVHSVLYCSSTPSRTDPVRGKKDS